MAVLTGKNIFSSKWITAEITDASNRIFYVPIKKTIGDYFLANIEGHEYCFKIDGSRIKVYQHTLVRSFRILHYDLNHYLPISADDNKELEEVIKYNGLPKMNMMLFNILKLLGKREKESFTPHDLEELVAEVAQHETEYKERVENIKNYLSHLNIKQIVTPVKKLTEFLEGDLIATDSKFMGTIVMQHARTDEEHKKVTNTPITGKQDWIKIMLVIAVIGIIAFAAYYLWSSGALTSLIPTFGIGAGTNNQLMAQYATPEELKAAIDRGEVDPNTLPPDMKKMLASYKPPKATPTP
jgi:hypothetical protein